MNLGRLSQKAPFFPYGTNSAIVTPVLVAQTSSLPAQSLNGKIETTSVVLAATSRPVEPLHLALRYRRYDVDNQTPRITFPGFVSWERTWSAGGRINVPCGYTNSRLDASVDYDLAPLVTLEAAYRRNTIDRTFRETEQTAENAVSGALDRRLHHPVAGHRRHGRRGAVLQMVPSTATLNLGARYQNLKGTAGFTTQRGSTYQNARASLGGVQDIPNADNVKSVRLDTSVDYALRPKMTLTVGAWYEDYTFSDVDSVGLQNIYPGAFLLALNDGSYNATVGYVRLTYRW